MDANRAATDASLLIRPMDRAEFDVLVDWADEEGWNPGLHDAEIFWATDPQGFVAAELKGEFVGGGSIVSYGGEYGFMGFFIVRSDLRGRGLGRQLWYRRRQLLLDRLEPGSAIGMDGVYDMQPFYTEGGFEFLHRDVRFEGPAPSSDGHDAGVVDVWEVDLTALYDYDRGHFPSARTAFLRRWIDQPGGHALAATSDGQVAGYVVSRPCRLGHKIGPLFADDPSIAENLFRSVCARLDRAPVQLDVPDCNAAGLDLARRCGMVEVFGCAKMILGPIPNLPHHEIFGVTTFELG